MFVFNAEYTTRIGIGEEIRIIIGYNSKTSPRFVQQLVSRTFIRAGTAPQLMHLSSIKQRELGAGRRRSEMFPRSHIILCCP